MADLSSSAAPAANNPYLNSIPYDAPSPLGGLVQHVLVSPTVQVQILSIVDATESATVGDIVAELPDHPDPAGAIVVMISSHILCPELRGGLMDANTIVRRCPEARPNQAEVNSASGDETHPVVAPARVAPATPAAGLTRLEASTFSAHVVVGAGNKRGSFGRMPQLNCPGIYGLMNGSSIYVGVSGDVGRRIATGQQPITGVDTIFAITDSSGTLTIEDARACERILWSRCVALGDRLPVNGLPDGEAVGARRYSELDLFVTQASLALREQRLLFTRGSVRGLLAGPRNEPRRTGPLRLPSDAPAGEVFELVFGDGLKALAAREAEDHWLLLRGSDVRVETAATAGAGPSFLRAAWAHSGLLELSADGSSYVVTRDLVFSSGSAAAVFCTGAKGRGRAGWIPVNRDHGTGSAPVAF
jgi:hypothetical protein